MTEQTNINAAPIVFEPTQAALREIAATASTLTIAKDGEQTVSRARKDLKALRVKIEARRKELKADALEYGRRVDEGARVLTGIIEPEERRLEQQEQALAEERAKVEREKLERVRVERARRLAIAVTFGVSFDPDEVAAMTPEAFISWCGVRGAEKQARDDAERQAAQERARLQREEEARMAEERRALAAERERLAEESRKLNAQRAAVAEPVVLPTIPTEYPPADKPEQAFLEQPKPAEQPRAFGGPVIAIAGVQPRGKCPTCGQPLPEKQEPEW